MNRIPKLEVAIQEVEFAKYLALSLGPFTTRMISSYFSRSLKPCLFSLPPLLFPRAPRGIGQFSVLDLRHHTIASQRVANFELSGTSEECPTAT